MVGIRVRRAAGVAAACSGTSHPSFKQGMVHFIVHVVSASLRRDRYPGVNITNLDEELSKEESMFWANESDCRWC